MNNDIEYNLKMTFKNDNPNDFSNGEIPVYYLNDKKPIMYEYIWEGGDSEPYIDIFLDTENSEYVHRITAEKMSQEGLDINDKDYETFVVNYMNHNTDITLNNEYYKLNIGVNGIEIVKDEDLISLKGNNNPLEKYNTLRIELFEETFYNTNYKMNDSVVSYYYKNFPDEGEIDLWFNKEQEEPDTTIRLGISFNNNEDIQEYVRDYIQRNANLYLDDIPVILLNDGKLLNIIDIDIQEINEALSKAMTEVDALMKEKEKLISQRKVLFSKKDTVNNEENAPF